MPKAVKVKGGYKVVNKHTGKTISRFFGKGAKAKADKLAAKGYY